MNIIATNIGKRFENNFRASVPSDVLYYRLKDSAQSFGGDNTLRFTLKNPCDCFIYNFPTFIPLELKSVGTSSISFERVKGDKGVIHIHQIEGLTDFAKHNGVVSGFVFNFRHSDESEICYFQEIGDFNTMVASLNKKSFNEKDLLKNNVVIIKNIKKKVNYKYDIAQFLKDISPSK